MNKLASKRMSEGERRERKAGRKKKKKRKTEPLF